MYFIVNYKIYTLFFLWLIGSSGAIAASASDWTLEFSKLNVTDGLSQSTVNAIAQDEQGYLWFATADGLDRYDGYQFKHYRHDRYDPYSLSQNEVQALLVDDLGRLWVGTYGGLNLYDPDKDNFTRFQHNPHDPSSLSDNMIFSLYKDGQGLIWIGTNAGGLNRLDPISLRFSRFTQDPNNKDSLNHNSVWPIHEDHQGFLWIGTQGGGLSRFNRQQQKFEPILYYPDKPEHPHNYISALNVDAFNNLWVGTLDGLLKRSNSDGKWRIYRHQANNPNSISHNNIWTLHRDADRRLWIGTDGGGLNVLDTKTNTFKVYKAADGPTSISRDAILSLYTDNARHLWVGTDKGGVNQGRREKFSHSFHKKNENKKNLSTKIHPEIQKKVPYGALSNGNVFALLKDLDRQLWVGTEDGLNHLDLKQGTNQVFRHDHNDKHSLPHDSVRALYLDRQNRLWIGSDADSLSLYVKEQQHFINYPLHPRTENEDVNNVVRVIIGDNKQGLWLGSRQGLSYFNPETENFNHYGYSESPQQANDEQLSSNLVIDLYQDAQNFLWIATDGGGLDRFDPQTQRFQHYRHDPKNSNSLSHNAISMIHADDVGDLWLGTFGGGLNHFSPHSGEFKHFREASGLANDVVYSILEDDNHCLWLTSNQGLSRFNPRENTFKHYDVSDGLQSSEFNANAAFKTHDGEMFFGGINGFNSFYPDRVQDNIYPPPVVLSQFKLFNKVVKVSDPDSVLTKSLANTEKITLSYQQSSFSFEFAALNFLFPEKNRYAYRLKNFDNDWNYVDFRREAYYTQVPPGQYIFQVKASNNDDIWTPLGTEIALEIVPPWWQTWWFKLASVSLLLLVIYLGYRARIAMITAQKQRLERKVDERTAALRKAKQAAEVASQSKSAFLASMSHELRTPLNGILGYAQILKDDDELPTGARKNMLIIQESGEYLLTLINDVLDIAQVEAGKLELYPKPLNLPELLASVSAIMKMKAAQQSISLKSNIDPNLTEGVLIDGKRLRQVLLNLLGNAVKFTPEGEVSLSAQQLTVTEKDQVTIEFEIKDSGVGMSEAEIEKIFSPFEQVGEEKQRAQGTGLGLAISQRLVKLMGGEIQVTSRLSHGSCFWFQITMPCCQLPKRQTVQRKVIAYLGDRRTILVVDDIRVNRLLLRQLLNLVGFQIIEAENGKLAIEQAQQHKPDLILMDLVMPELDGFGAASAIRQDKALTHIPIVALSANIVEHSKTHEAAHNFSGFLAKPVKKEALWDCIQTHLQLQWQYKNDDA